MINGMYPEGMLARPRTSLGAWRKLRRTVRPAAAAGRVPVIQQYMDYAAAGMGAANVIAQNPRFRERFQRERRAAANGLPWEPASAHVSRQGAAAGLGSYIDMTQAQYQTFQHESPWHAGAPGWTKAPVPGWGMNPALAYPQRKATEGLGAYYANHYTAPIAIGADTPVVPLPWYEKYDAEKVAVVIALTALATLGVLKWRVKNASKKRAAVAR